MSILIQLHTEYLFLNHESDAKYTYSIIQLFHSPNSYQDCTLKQHLDKNTPILPQNHRIKNTGEWYMTCKSDGQTLCSEKYVNTLHKVDWVINASVHEKVETVYYICALQLIS